MSQTDKDESFSLEKQSAGESEGELLRAKTPGEKHGTGFMAESDR